MNAVGALPEAVLPPAQFLALAVVIEYVYELDELVMKFGPIEVRA